MSALSLNLRVQQRATFRKTIRYLDAAGQPKQLATWSGRAQIKSAYGNSSQSLLNLTTQTGEIILTNAGEITIFLDEDQTNSLPVVYKTPGPGFATYYYDLFLNDPQKGWRRFLVGNVYVTGALTDAI